MLENIFVFRGNSACGKSSTAKELKKSLGNSTLLISQDEVRKIMLDEKDKPNNKSISLIETMINWADQNVDFVILEGILKRDVYADMLFRLKNQYQKKMKTFYFDIFFEETYRRNLLKKKPFSRGLMQDWWLDNDRFGYEDHVFTINDDLPARMKYILKIK
ncbi:kinase [Oenococcus oeni]|uniref:kinase n=1 Tax=Oenococcus oeni TaxID=1247 RepID=UPI0008F868FE|nr:kinase [Oenococcus oeni]OIK57509.1 hypothetical protein ATW61_02650 [Oenococcus oeni]OIM64181.1 hypothetical protein ATX87_02675 [Oenococcus oeni]